MTTTQAKRQAVVKPVRMDAISLDERLQQRVRLPDREVAEVALVVLGEVERLEPLKPVVLFDDGERLWLADGHIRYHAHTAAQQDEILAEVRKGTFRDAWLYSLRANAGHGCNRAPEDVRRCVESILADEEASGWSQRQIATFIGVSHACVNDWVKKIRAETVARRAGGVGAADAPAPPPPKVEGSSTSPGRDGTEDGEEAAGAPAANGKPPKSGAVTFDDKVVVGLLGKLTRAVNDRIKAKGTTAKSRAAWAALENFAQKWESWAKGG